MRSIKFRAWFDYPPRLSDQLIYPESADTLSDFFGTVEGVITDEGTSATLEQYTGLKDKNGVEIYEGDICEHLIGMDRDRVIEVNGSVNAFLNIIEWQSAAWGFRPVFPALCHEDDKEWRSFHVDPFEGEDWGSDDFEVIGNIHQDSHLLD